MMSKRSSVSSVSHHPFYLHDAYKEEFDEYGYDSPMWCFHTNYLHMSGGIRQLINVIDCNECIYAFFQIINFISQFINISIR